MVISWSQYLSASPETLLKVLWIKTEDAVTNFKIFLTL